MFHVKQSFNPSGTGDSAVYDTNTAWIRFVSRETLQIARTGHTACGVIVSRETLLPPQGDEPDLRLAAQAEICAFAAQALAVTKDLGLDPEKTNVNGGAVAIGHPIGASGGRILCTLIYEMKKRNSHYGLATLCIGGGMGTALIVEMDQE